MRRLPENIRAMYADAYKLHETLFDIGNTVDDWAKTAQLCTQICQKHGNHPLIMNLAQAVYAQLESDREGDASGP